MDGPKQAALQAAFQQLPEDNLLRRLFEAENEDDMWALLETIKHAELVNALRQLHAIKQQFAQ